MRKSRRTLGRMAAVAVAALVATGCASSSGSSATDGRRDTLTREQIMSVNATNLYQVVERLRPAWLRQRSRGIYGGNGEILVVRNGTVIGDKEMLRQLSPENIAEMRYKDGRAVGASLVGSRDGIVEAVIEITTGSDG